MAATNMQIVPRIPNPPLPTLPPTQTQLDKVAPILQLAPKDYNTTQALATACFYALNERIVSLDIAKQFRDSDLAGDLAALRNEEGDTIMTAAARAGDAKKVNILARARFAHNTLDSGGNNVLAIVATEGHSDLIPTLVHRVEIDHYTGNQEAPQTPLHLAIAARQHSAVKQLIELGADTKLEALVVMNGKKFCLTPLALAVAHNDTESIKLLIKQPEPQLSVFLYGNILHLATLLGCTEALTYLLDKHMDICEPLLKEPNGTGEPPLLTAAASGAYDILQIFQKMGLNLMVTTRTGLTALHIATRELHEEIMRFLIFHCPQLLTTKNTERLDPPQYAATLARELGSEDYNDMKTLLDQLDRLRERGELKLPDFTRQPPQNLVLRGGGPAGVVYGGVFKYLCDWGVSDGMLRKAGTLDSSGVETPSFISGLKRIAGASAGAIGAAFIGTGFTPDEVRGLLKTDLLSFLDLTKDGEAFLKNLGKKDIADAVERWEDTVVSLIKQTAKGAVRRSWKGAFLQALQFNFSRAGKKIGEGLKQQADGYPSGLCSGDKFEKWMEDEIAKKTGVSELTFGELKARVEAIGSDCTHIHVYVTWLKPDGSLSIERLTSEFTDEELANGEAWYKDVVVSSAIRASMSIPLAFVPATLKIKPNASDKAINWPEKGRFLDGGMLMNYPIEAFDARKYQTQRPVLEKGAEEQHIMNRRTLGVTLYNSNKKEEEKGSAPKAATHSKTKSSKKEEVTPLILAQRICKIYMGAEDLIRDAMGPWNESRTVQVDRLGVEMLDFQIDDTTKDALFDSGFDCTEGFFAKGSGARK